MRSWLVLVVCIYLICTCNGIDDVKSKPPHEQVVRAARWLVCNTKHSVLATDGAVANEDVASDKNKIPFANVVSHADGSSPENCTGFPYFYLTKLDPTARDLARNAWSTLTISLMNAPGGCITDPEDPTCWKISLIGKTLPVSKSDEKTAMEALYARHPEMKSWPTDHNFQAYHFQVEKVFFIDFFGGAPKISVKDYASVSSSSIVELAIQGQALV